MKLQLSKTRLFTFVIAGQETMGSGNAFDKMFCNLEKSLVSEVNVNEFRWKNIPPSNKSIS